MFVNSGGRLVALVENSPGCPRTDLAMLGTLEFLCNLPRLCSLAGREVNHGHRVWLPPNRSKPQEKNDGGPNQALDNRHHTQQDPTVQPQTAARFSYTPPEEPLVNLARLILFRKRRLSHVSLADHFSRLAQFQIRWVTLLILSRAPGSRTLSDVCCAPWTG